jgi:hypothetical protein
MRKDAKELFPFDGALQVEIMTPRRDAVPVFEPADGIFALLHA